MQANLIASSEQTQIEDHSDRSLAKIAHIPGMNLSQLWELANSKLHGITEKFYSFQGEGETQGQPAYFIRYSKCNFRCEWCDSKRTWLNKDTQSAQEMVEALQATPARNVVITGGEPMLNRYAPEFVAFIYWLKMSGYHVEVESDAALPAPPQLLDVVDQWNLSPKLGSSGVLMTERYRSAIQAWVHYEQQCNRNVWYKFVVRDESDFAEVQAFQKAFGLTKERMWLMPEGNTITAQLQNMPYVAEKCIAHGYRFAVRAHILVWNDKEGV